MQITWYGHSAFRLDFKGQALLIDPFFTGNPAFESNKADAMKGVSHILLTHGHSDHVGDTVEIARATGATVTGVFELCMWLAGKGVEKVNPMNTGGTTAPGDFTVTMVRADHSASDIVDGTPVYLGSPCGVIVKAAGQPTVYHLGDTDVFGDMALINALHQPKVGLVPIGDRFTMGARTAAYAVKNLFTFETVIPCHYGSFPIIDRDAAAFVAEMKDAPTKVVVPEKGRATAV